MTPAIDLIACIVAVLWTCVTAYRWSQGDPASPAVWVMALCGGCAVAWRCAVSASRDR